MEVFGNLGGLMQLFTFFICLFVNPIAKHWFTLDVISSFYLVKTNGKIPFFIINKEKNNQNEE